VLNGAFGMSPGSAGKPKRRCLAALHNPPRFQAGARRNTARSRKGRSVECGEMSPLSMPAVGANLVFARRRGEYEIRPYGQACKMWAKVRFDPSLRPQRGRDARQPFGIPGHCGAPRAGARHRPPSLVSVSVCGRSVAGVSPGSHSFPARVAAFRVGPLGDASSARGGAGGCGARWGRRPTAGVGRGRSRHPPRRGLTGRAHLASVTSGSGLERLVAPWPGGSRSSASKVPLARRSITRANGTSCC
jgi:hypothetical protein